MRIGPVESENHFLLKETVKTKSHMVKMMVYIRKTDHKQCVGTQHHFHCDKTTKTGSVTWPDWDPAWQPAAGLGKWERVK